MKSGVFCRRNYCIAFAWCDGALSCMNSWTRSHCPDKVDDIQAVKKSSTDQCNSSGPLLFSVDQWKRYQFFHSKKLRCLSSPFSIIGILNGTAVLVWNVNVIVRISWNGKTGIFSLIYRKQKWTRTVTENNSMRLKSRMEVQFSRFSTNCFDWISTSCSETCYWLFCTFRTPNTLLRISLL